MGRKFAEWRGRAEKAPRDLLEIKELLLANRSFEAMDRLEYGDHGLQKAADAVVRAIRSGKRIALYADYDVDGTMSCVSWIWFLEAIGYRNFVHYIPCRFKEGYGLNMQAVRHLVENERAELIITMDTGITANEEAAYCRERGVEFLCTDHHMVQPERMPDCIILNPKLHPDPRYQELCGCGITFVLLRRLSESFPVPKPLWTDLLALAGMATICDVVPLGGVNHKLARMGVEALCVSRRPVLRRLLEAAQVEEGPKGVDEKDIGFRLGPRINAVGRLEHADAVIQAFIGQEPDELIRHMGACNERRKALQKRIVEEARRLAAEHVDDPILFLGGDWHPGVVGIAATKIAEMFWKPVWLFERGEETSKGSARAIPGFDVTSAMLEHKDLFVKCGGHRAAGGFTFATAQEEEIRRRLNESARELKKARPDLWRSKVDFDTVLPMELVGLSLADVLDELKPFGHGFDEPRFLIEAELVGTRFFYDKETGDPRHTAVFVKGASGGPPQKILFFHEVHRELEGARKARFVVSAARNRFRGEVSLALHGVDFELQGG